MRRENEAALASLRRAMAQPAEADLPGNGAAGFFDFGHFLVLNWGTDDAAGT